MIEGVGAADVVGVVQGGPVPDGHQHVLEPMTIGAVVVDVARGHDRNPKTVGQAPQKPVPAAVSLGLVVLELHEEPIRGDVSLEPAGEGLSGRGRILEVVEQGAFPAPRQDDQAFVALQ